MASRVRYISDRALMGVAGVGNSYVPVKADALLLQHRDQGCCVGRADWCGRQVTKGRGAAQSGQRPGARKPSSDQAPRQPPAIVVEGGTSGGALAFVVLTGSSRSQPTVTR